MPQDRFGYWHEVACARIVDHLSVPDCRDDFEARIQAANVADIDQALLEHSPIFYDHTRSQASTEASGKVMICQQIEGRTIMEQDGRTATLHPGQRALFDPQRPYVGRSIGTSRLLVTKVPRSGLEARLGSLQTASAVIMNASESGNDFVSAFLAMLPHYAAGLDSTVHDIVQEQVVDLLAASLAKALDKPGPARSVSLTRLRVRAAIEALLPNPDLTVRDVATRAGVSVRYANQALSGEGSSIMRLVLTRRLEKCRQALDDVLQDRRSISDIAYAWGFSDMTHFARKFSQFYGVLPRDYRQMVRSGRSTRT